MVKKAVLYLKNNNEGYSLIEMLCAISIFIILSSVSIVCLKNYNGIKNQIYIKYTDNQIVNFINNSRAYCKSRKVNGAIFIDEISKSLIFYKNAGDTIDKFCLPDGYKIYSLETAYGRISIDEEGSTQDACTIRYRDLSGTLHKITLCVGTENVEIK